MNPEAPRPFLDIGERLKWHRIQVEGSKQSDYAETVGLSRNRYANWEAGTHRLSLDGALALHRRFGLSLDWLYTGDDGALSLPLFEAWRDHQHNEEPVSE